jgi:phage N-6-adenine-methyltransferase
MNENIIINPELHNLLDPLSEEEYKYLEESLLKEGCRDSIILWNETLIDGHNRYEICQKYNIKFNTYQLNFESIIEAEKWIIINAFGRRNINTYQRSKYYLKYEKLIAPIAKENQKLSKGRGKKGLQISADLNIDTREEVAKKAGVSHDTIYKVKKIEAKATDEIKEQLSSGDISVNEAYKKITVHVGQNSGENEWYTPSNIIELARQTMGSIDLDPATSEIANETVKAEEIFTKETNGLDKPWSGNVWLNPPYSQPLITEFSKKIVDELSNINQACVLVNNATETNWLQNIMSVCNAVCLIKSRIKFIDMNGNASGAPLQGQIILYFGNNLNNFYNNFNTLGICLKKMTIEEEQ